MSARAFGVQPGPPDLSMKILQSGVYQAPAHSLVPAVRSSLALLLYT